MIDNFDEIIDLYNQSDAPEPTPPPEFDSDLTTLGNIILGSATANFIYQNLGTFRDWLTGIFGQLNEGIVVNNVSEYVQGYPVTYGTKTSSWSSYTYSHLEIYIGEYTISKSVKNPVEMHWIRIDDISYRDSQSLLVVTTHAFTKSGNYQEVQRTDIVYPGSEFLSNYPIEQPEELEIYINPYAPLLSEDQAPPLGPLVMPNIKQVNPNSENIQLMPMPDGTVKEIYTGDIQQYEDELLEHITFEDLQTITDPAYNPVQQLKVNNQDYIVLDPVVGNTPYPEITDQPIQDQTEYQGKSIGLLMGIVNWLKLIWEAIMSIPQWLTDLFVLPEGYWDGNFNTIKTKLLTKFDQEGSINFIDGLSNIAAKPIPDLYYKESIILENDWVNGMASNIKSWLRFFLWVAMVLFGMNSAYKLIRGGDAIERGWYNDSKGSN